MITVYPAERKFTGIATQDKSKCQAAIYFPAFPHERMLSIAVNPCFRQH